MKKTKRSTGSAVTDLCIRLPIAIRLLQEIEELSERLKNEKSAIREALEDANLQRYAAPSGEEALLVDEERLIFNAEKLAGELTEDEYAELCPPKPDTSKLRALMETDAERAKALRKCAKVSHTSRLELRAAEQRNEEAVV
jgi:hypothetical protein